MRRLAEHEGLGDETGLADQPPILASLPPAFPAPLYRLVGLRFSRLTGNTQLIDQRFKASRKDDEALSHPARQTSEEVALARLFIWSTWVRVAA